MIHNSHPEPEERGDKSPRKTYPCNETLRAEFIQFLADHPEWSQGKLRRAMGYSESVYSQYTSPEGNLYSGDTKKLEGKIEQFLRDQRIVMEASVATVACEITEQIFDALEDIRTAKRIGVICGEPGIGKTRGIHHFTAKNTLAIYHAVRTWARNPACLSAALFNAADVQRGKGGIADLLPKMRGSGRVVIIDDAHKLTRSALQMLYDFRDETQIPIALFGDNRLVTKLRDDAQRLRRTGSVWNLKIKNPDPMIKHLIDSVLPDVGSERDDLVELCRQLAFGEGHYGSVEMELSMAARLKRGKPDWSWCEAVRRAHKKLIRNQALN